MDVIAIFISGISLLFSLFTFILEKNRQKKYDTLEAIKDLQNNVINQFHNETRNYLAGNKQKDGSLALRIGGEDYYKLATECLVAIEHFSVGVNNGIFDKKIVKECGGAYFCRLYQFLKPVIEKKKVTSPDGEHYDNFTKLYNTLLKYYKDKDIYYHPTKN